MEYQPNDTRATFFVTYLLKIFNNVKTDKKENEKRIHLSLLHLSGAAITKALRFNSGFYIMI